MERRIKTWFEKYPERFAYESDVLIAKGFTLNETIFKNELLVCFEGELGVDQGRKFTIRFPNTFPSLPPRVFDSVDSPLLRRHHHPDSRQLCLFGPGDARWNSNCGSEDVLREVMELIRDSKTFGELIPADDVPEPISATLNYDNLECIFIPPPLSLLDFRNGMAQERMSFELTYIQPQKKGDYRRSVLTSVNIGSEEYKIAHHYKGLYKEWFQVLKGPIFWISESPTNKSLNDFLHSKIDEGTVPRKSESILVAVVFSEQSTKAQTQRIGWIFARLYKNGSFSFYQAFPYRASERGARIPNVEKITEKRVVLVGCGCLGSKIAVNIAACGVQNFGLIDCERMEPYNSVRHEIGVRSFGLPKVLALANRINDINPETLGNINFLHLRIGAINSIENEELVQNFISTAAVVIDTTGVHGVSRWLNDVCHDLGVPTIYASVTNGAWGGEVVRVVPNYSPCWLCWNEQYANNGPPSQNTEGFFAPGCNQPSFTGTSHDTGFVANLASTFVVSTLMNNMNETDHYIRWSGRDSGGIPIFHTDILSIKKREICPLCNPHYATRVN